MCGFGFILGEELGFDGYLGVVLCVVGKLELYGFLFS